MVINVINFIDDYSGLTILYFLKHKSDTLLTTKKYQADIGPLRPCKVFTEKQRNRVHFKTFSTVTST